MICKKIEIEIMKNEALHPSASVTNLSHLALLCFTLSTVCAILVLRDEGVSTWGRSDAYQITTTLGIPGAIGLDAK